MLLRKKVRGISLLEGLIVILLCSLVFFISGKFDFFEKVVTFAHKYESLEVDELISVSLFLVVVLVFLLIRKVRELIAAHIDLKTRNEQLEKAYSEISLLRGIIPICSSCKDVRTDEGYWQNVEAYVQAHSDARFSHGICPACIEQLYPDMVEAIQDKLSAQKAI